MPDVHQSSLHATGIQPATEFENENIKYGDMLEVRDVLEVGSSEP